MAKEKAPILINKIFGVPAKKDFFELYYLMQHFSLRELVGFYFLKHPNTCKLGLLKSLVFFYDVENEPNPATAKVNWQTVKSEIRKQTAKLVL